MDCGEPDYCLWDLFYVGKIAMEQNYEACELVMFLLFWLGAHQLLLFCDRYCFFECFFLGHCGMYDLVNFKV